MPHNTGVNNIKVCKMLFKYSVKGFSNYVFAKNGYVIRLFTVTKHQHYKKARFISYRKDGRVALNSDKGKKETLSKVAIKKVGFVKLDKFIFIPMSCQLNETPF